MVFQMGVFCLKSAFNGVGAGVYAAVSVKFKGSPITCYRGAGRAALDALTEGSERVFIPRFPLHIIPCAIGNAAPSVSGADTSPVTSDGGGFKIKL